MGTWPVTCEVLDLDRYGRLVARCTAGGHDIGEQMVELGWALAYRRYSRDYVEAEDTAKAVELGI